MGNDKEKYSTVLSKETIAALKRFTGYKQVAASTVIEQALLKCITKRFFTNPHKTG